MEPKFIEIPIFLMDNSPDDVDYESLGIEQEGETIEEVCLLNVSDVQRVNRATAQEYETVIWTYDGGSYHTSLDYDHVRALIEACYGRIPKFIESKSEFKAHKV